MENATFDKSELYKWWDILRDKDQLTEIRLISNDGKTASGIFDNVENIARAIEPYTKDWNIFYTINRLPDDVRGLPQYNRIIVRPKQTCNDNTFIARDYICIDLDSVRLSGTNATEEQIGYTKQTANKIYKYLIESGFYAPVVVFSGSGVHLYIKCAMVNNEQNRDLVKRFLKSLSMMFSDEHTECDCAVFNCGRIMRLPSTFSRKGNTLDPQRPQRMCYIVKAPEEVQVNHIEYIKKIADLYPDEPERPSRYNNYSTERFDLEKFIEKHGIDVTGKSQVADGTRYYLDHCCFNPDHRGKDAIIFQHNNGAVAYHCFHQSCCDKTWRDVRLMYEPDCYDKVFTNRFNERLSRRPKETFTLEEETAEKGKKWLCMGDIKDVSLEDMLTIKTGIEAIDKKIVGLFAGELTVFSGLSGAGKTSFLNLLALNAVEQGYKVGLWSGEMQDFRFRGWLMQIAAGKSYTAKKIGYDNLYYTPKKYADLISQWLNDSLYLYNNKYGNNWQQLFADIQELVEREKVKLIVLDNLAALSIDDYDGDNNTKQKQFIQDVKDYAKQTNIHVVVVAHPRKENFFLRKESVSGTADLINLADNLLLIHRVSKDFEKRASEFFGADKTKEFMDYNAVIEVSKCRQMGVTDFLAGVYYEPESRRLKNSIAENKIYGWCNAMEESERKDLVAVTEGDGVQSDFGYIEPVEPNAAFLSGAGSELDLSYNGEDSPF